MGKIKIIAHLADIHIRKLRRFVEYREVFELLYKKLRSLSPDLIFIGGDIVHGKLDTSPEEIRLIADFFLSLSNISPLIVIPGNHDCNLNNRSREDTLSPIIDLVKKINKNVHYFKHSGRYTIKNVDFGVLSIFDRDTHGNQIVHNLPDPKEMANDHKIALFHGGVGTFIVDTGLTMSDKRVTTSTFDGYDLVLLGDIHKRQFLNDDKTIAYPGSLIQQNFAEDTSHGFLLWDIENKTSEFHQVENNYGFKTVEVENGKIINKMKFVPPMGSIKMKYWNTSLEDLRDIQLSLRKKYPRLKDIKAEKLDTFSIDKNSRANKINVGDVRDVKHQNKLISEFLIRHVENVDEDTIDRVCSINKSVNNSPEIVNGDVTRNVDWKIKSFEFDNMFSYGEGNTLNFENLDGLIGVVAPNHSGKSSMFDAIAYTIYDTCSRAWKSIEILNKKKKRFKAKLNLEINGESYWIERTGKLKTRRNRKTKEVTYSCPVDVKFYMEDGDEFIDLTGASRRTTQYGSGTNEEIRKILGTFDDFILTSLSLQTNGINFIDKKQSERKQILSQFMDIEIFDQLYEIAKTDSNDERVILKTLQKNDSYKKLVSTDEKILDLEKVESDWLSQKTELDLAIKVLLDEKLSLAKQRYKIDEFIENVDDLKDKFEALNAELKIIRNKLKDDLEYKENLRPLYLEHYKKLSGFDEDRVHRNYEEYTSLSKKIERANSNMKLIENSLNMEFRNLKELEKYNYDEECEYCLNNAEEHINHKKSIDEKILELTNQCNTLTLEIDSMMVKFEDVDDAEEVQMEYDALGIDLNSIQHDAVKIGGKISTTEERINFLESEIELTDDKIQKYYSLEKKIKNNDSINSKISQVEIEISFLEERLKDVEDNYSSCSSDLSISKAVKAQLEDEIQRLLDIEQTILDYDLYLMAISRDGIPYELISKTIPQIEAEVNTILDSMMVGFSIKLEMKGKNIDAYICYGDTRWNLELSSGMERFVSSLAIRIGLINVSTLPRPNFLVIDEGFGTLDGDNIANMGRALGQLKTQFDYIMVITHLDVVKDYMDTLVPIESIDGFSKVVLA